MSRQTRNLILGLDLSATGVAPTVRHFPGGDGPIPFDTERFAELAATAERGTLDFIALGEDFRLESEGNRPRSGALDAAVGSARLAKLTTRIGFVPTISTSHIDPHHVAAAVTAINAVSSGRAAWQASAQVPEATVTAVRQSWDAERETPAPVVVRAGNAESLDLAARHADVVRILAVDVDSALAQRRRVREIAAEAGRNPDDVRVLVDLYSVTGPDRASAQARLELLGHIDGGRQRENTISFVGTPTDLAGLIETWFRAGAADGFVVTPSSLHVDVFGLVDGVVPVLQHAGVFRKSYSAAGLGSSLGRARARRRATV